MKSAANSSTTNPADNGLRSGGLFAGLAVQVTTSCVAAASSAGMTWSLSGPEARHISAVGLQRWPRTGLKGEKVSKGWLVGAAIAGGGAMFAGLSVGDAIDHQLVSPKGRR
jgi:hypothetical protein